MPATFEITRREPIYGPDGSTAAGYFFAGTITDDALPGQSLATQFTLSPGILSSFPADAGEREVAIDTWLAEQVNRQHFTWVNDQPSDKQPEPLLNTAARTKAAQSIRIEETYADAGAPPKTLTGDGPEPSPADGGDISAPTATTATGKGKGK
jgi:hypothetical protein